MDFESLDIVLTPDHIVALERLGDEIAELLPDVPSAPRLPADPLQALHDTNLRHGLHIDAHTSRPTWTGERLDVAWAIDVLHPRANPRAYQ